LGKQNSIDLVEWCTYWCITTKPLSVCWQWFR